MRDVSKDDNDGKATPSRRRTPRAKAEAATPRKQQPRAATRRVSTTRAKVERGPTAAAPLRGVPSAPPAVTSSAIPTDLPDDRYFNRELSWLDFNARVLALAEDPSQPLLERVKFLAIFASNLDEFYMVRVAGLKRRNDTGLTVRSADGLSPREQLARIATRTQALASEHARVFLTEVQPRLDTEGIHIVRWSALDDAQRRELSGYFMEKVFPVLTPLAVDHAHP